MKKEKICCFVIILALALNLIMCTSMYAEFSLDFGYSNLQAKSEIQSAYLAFEGEFRKDNVRLDIMNELYRSKKDKILEDHRAYNDVQLNLYYGKPYFFANIETLTDRALNIRDELMYGIGTGYEGINFDIQAGLYGCSTDNDNETILKSDASLIIAVNNTIDLVQDYSFDVKTENKEDYRINGEVAIKLNLREKLALKTGLEINYVNQPAYEAKRKTKRYFSGLSLSF